MPTIDNVHVNKFIVFTFGITLHSNCFVCFDAVLLLVLVPVLGNCG